MEVNTREDINSWFPLSLRCPTFVRIFSYKRQRQASDWHTKKSEIRTGREGRRITTCGFQPFPQHFYIAQDHSARFTNTSKLYFYIKASYLHLPLLSCLRILHRWQRQYREGGKDIETWLNVQHERSPPRSMSHLSQTLSRQLFLQVWQQRVSH